MNLVQNAAGAFGLSTGNLVKEAMKFVGLPEGVAAAIGAVLDLKKGNFGSLLFHTGPEALAALTGGNAGSAHAVERPNNVMGTVARVGGFALLGGAAARILGGGAGGGAVGGAALGGLTSMMGGGLGLMGGLGLGAVAGGGTNMAFNMLAGGFQGSALRNTLGITRTDVSPDSMLARLPKPACFEDIVAAFMIDFVKDKQDEITQKLDKLRKSAQHGDGDKASQGAGGFFGGLMRNIPLVGGLVGRGQDAATQGNSESRNIEFEMLKNEMQKLSQMQQAMSNVLNEMHNLAMSAIRNIKG